MMADVVSEYVLPAEKRGAVDRMAKFIAIFHAKYFLQAFLPSAAPRLDLAYWNDMVEFHRYDPEISFEVHESLLRHLWYLTEELTVLSLFDRELDYQSRTDIANTLLSYPRPQTFAPQKPVFPTSDRLSNNPAIDTFIGPRSWLFFDVLGIHDPGWLHLPSEEWASDAQYQEIESIVADLSVTNDTAERAVNKVTQYANSANDGGQRGKIVEVVSWHHSKMKGYTKNDLENVL